MDIQRIANSELTLDDIPLANAPWEKIGAFALTFDGYKHWGSFEKCADIANAQKGDTLTELRTCLFIEQRRWRHFGDEPDDEAISYIRSTLESIRAKVAARDVE